jgi:hypothetical protein
MRPAFFLLGAALAGCAAPRGGAWDPARLRLIIETDAGGDPDDEQSLVRFLLYVNEWDVEGIIANRPVARDRENLNPERTGLGIVRRFLKAYGECYPNLVEHDPRYPKPEFLWERTVAGYEDTNEGVDLMIAAVDRDDPRPVWFTNWGTDHGSAPSSLKRALDRVLRERGPEGYAKFKSRLRISGDDQFGDHTMKIPPAFPLWVDTLSPPLDGKRWYHRFSAITARAGGFDIERDVRTGHGPLGALYPLNTTHPQKEGDTMMFLYLVPTGMNDPERPSWGSWAGRYGPREDAPFKSYYWANEADTWEGTTHRENSLRRWADHFQNDFRARLDWCVKPFGEANHAPEVSLAREPEARPGGRVRITAAGSKDPDGNRLTFRWCLYREAGTYPGEIPLEGASSAEVSLVIPRDAGGGTLHLIVAVTDDGEPPLTRYGRSVLTVRP